VPSEPPSRRPLKSRQTRWARALAGRLAAAGVAPNAISAASMLLAAGAGAALLGSAAAAPGARALLLLAAAAGIQLRLLCNLLDGMVAIEGGRRSPGGDLWNEVPDRVADSVVLVAAGYALPGLAWAPAAGWAAALLAALTAYVRVLGGSLGLPQDFGGPMAKPHRMAALTAACLLAIAEEWALGSRTGALALALAAIVAGSAVTAARRLARIARALAAR
jgi:phosphatidylglycerophosphate synthase